VLADDSCRRNSRPPPAAWQRASTWVRVATPRRSSPRQRGLGCQRSCTSRVLPSSLRSPSPSVLCPLRAGWLTDRQTDRQTDTGLCRLNATAPFCVGFDSML
jgi:hypothetical protein